MLGRAFNQNEIALRLLAPGEDAAIQVEVAPVRAVVVRPDRDTTGWRYSSPQLLSVVARRLREPDSKLAYSVRFVYALCFAERKILFFGLGCVILIGNIGMTRSINVAFQGGGARLITLIAAAEAISDLERNGFLRVESISGSSAGALAAFLLAANADFEAVKNAIRRREKGIQRYFPRLTKLTLRLKLARFLLDGTPIFPPTSFNEVISEMLGAIRVDSSRPLKDYANGRSLHIVASDIYQGKSVALPVETPIRSALRQSCAIPVVFATFKSDDGGQQVDGGVFDNLPVEIVMPAGASSTPVFAIGFAPEVSPVARSGAEYLMSMISSVISYRVAESRKAIGEDRVYMIDTRLGTLDFDKMVTVGLDKEYGRIKSETDAFFRPWIGGANADAPVRQTDRLAAVRLKQTEQKLLSYVLEALKGLPASSPSVQLRVTAHCLDKADRPDEISFEQTIRMPADRVVPGVVLYTMSGTGSSAQTECHVHLDGPTGEPIIFSEFVIHDTIVEGLEEKRRTAVILLFHGDCSSLAGKLIYVLKKELRYGFMAPLRTDNRDVLSVRSWHWPTREVSIQLNIPKSFGRKVAAEWTRVGDGGEPVARVADKATCPAGFESYLASLGDVPVNTVLKGVFTAS